MGTCFCDSRTIRSEKRSNTSEAIRTKETYFERLYTNQIERTTKENNNNGLAKGCLKETTLEKRKTKINHLFITLEELFEANALSQEQWKLNNMQSVSIKLSNRESEVGTILSSQQQIESSIIKKASFRQHIDGIISLNKSYSKLSLCLDEMDLQFLLPQQRAGPIVVPFINYNNYQL